jgi:hypothetical protein
MLTSMAMLGYLVPVTGFFAALVASTAAVIACVFSAT